MYALIRPLAIVFLALVGIAVIWQSSSTRRGLPMGEDIIHQMHVDRICNIYDVIRRIRPGLTSPPNLYDYLGVRRGRDADTLSIWRASALRAGHYLNDNRDPEHKLFLQASTAMLDQATRSLYDGTFWPMIEAAPSHEKVEKLRELCGWSQE